MPNESWDYFLRQGSVLGLAFVFLAGVLLILLWVGFTVVRILVKWLPEYFRASIESFHEVAKGMKSITKMVDKLHRSNDATNTALDHLVTAVDKHITSQPDRLGIESDVLDHIRYAKHILKRRSEILNRGMDSTERKEEDEERRKRKKDYDDKSWQTPDSELDYE